MTSRAGRPSVEGRVWEITWGTFQEELWMVSKATGNQIR